MKKISKLLVMVFTLSLLHSCWWRNERETAQMPRETYEPVIISRAELQNISLQAPKPTVKNAKIYIKDQYIFVNDSKKGFHIIYNSNPSQPQKLKFLNALGSTDVAIRNNVLYINQARDLVALQINPATSEVKVLKRIENIFPALRAPNGQTVNVK